MIFGALVSFAAATLAVVSLLSKDEASNCSRISADLVVKIIKTWSELSPSLDMTLDLVLPMCILESGPQLIDVSSEDDALTGLILEKIADLDGAAY